MKSIEICVALASLFAPLSHVAALKNGAMKNLLIFLPLTEEVSQLLRMSGAEVLDDPWDLHSHQAQRKLVIRCVDSEDSPPTPAEIELFNGESVML